MNRVDTNASAAVHAVDLAPLDTVIGTHSAISARRLGALAGVKAQVSVVAGNAHTTVGEVLTLKEGAILTLDTALNAPFDVMLNGTVIARGELVAVGEHFGVRITQVQASEGA
jgi:flagellar motor switch protein FliN/FliY